MAASNTGGWTKGPIHIRKCGCGDPVCDQYSLSTQGGVGFSLADATIYAAAPDLAEALAEAREALWAIEDSAVEAGFDKVADIIADLLTKANAALSKAHGQ